MARTDCDGLYCLWYNREPSSGNTIRSGITYRRNTTLLAVRPLRPVGENTSEAERNSVSSEGLGLASKMNHTWRYGAGE